MKKVLVTGATGFLGSSLLPLLESRGYQIHAMGRNKELGLKLETPSIKFFQGDITRIDDLRRAARGCGEVVHAASLSTLWGPWEAFYNCNVLGTEQVLKICDELQIRRLVYISSPSVYCTAKDQWDIKEDQQLPRRSMNFYIKSKKMAEECIKQWNNPSLQWVILRPRALFGIGDSSIIPRLLKANRSFRIPLFRHGRNTMDITYVDNVSQAIYLALTVPDISGEVFNITNGEPMEFRSMLKALFDSIGEEARYLKLPRTLLYGLAGFLEMIYRIFHIKKEPSLTRYTVLTLGFSQSMNIEKAEKLLGYRPLISVEEGIRIYADWYKQHDQS